MPDSTVLQQTTVTIARGALGTVVAAHGIQKFFLWGMEESTEVFTGLGVPAPALAAAMAGVIEIVGGALLIIGAFARTAGVSVTVVMLGAAVFSGMSAPSLFAADGGPELALTVAAGAALLTVFGPGTWSVDALRRPAEDRLIAGT